jgi:hypothetical protein
MKHNVIKTDAVIDALKGAGVDAYLIITSEGSDPMLPRFPGVGSVGDAAFLFTSKGRKIGVCSKIDAQDIEESGLFDEVRKYDDYLETLAVLVREVCPRAGTLALNYASEDQRFDGLTLGRYRRFKNALGDFPLKEVSSALFMEKLYG